MKGDWSRSGTGSPFGGKNAIEKDSAEPHNARHIQKFTGQASQFPNSSGFTAHPVCQQGEYGHQLISREGYRVVVEVK